jgi:hypothetical protein|uniref:Uncharacterized protein n=1 Tax=viral metagenome TaxID=1070528 RepID=A0A6C0JGC9_9ZZZZ
MQTFNTFFFRKKAEDSLPRKYYDKRTWTMPLKNVEPKTVRRLQGLHFVEVEVDMNTV